MMQFQVPNLGKLLPRANKNAEPLNMWGSTGFVYEFLFFQKLKSALIPTESAKNIHTCLSPRSNIGNSTIACKKCNIPSQYKRKFNFNTK